jgi:peptide/nickel transport system substrate-binding protein
MRPGACINKENSKIRLLLSCYRFAFRKRAASITIVQRTRLLSITAFILILLALNACRTPPSTATPTSSTQNDFPLPTVSESEKVLVTVEATKIVIETEVVEVTSTPSPTPVLPKKLVICIAEEPESLYLYSQPHLSISMSHVHSALYEPLYTSLSYDYQSRGLLKIPSLADGDAIIREIEVEAGDTVLDLNGNVVTLGEGVRIGTSDGQESTFQEDPVIMDQMIVTFELKPLVWSDGTLVSAEDSVYSFELASDPITPVPKLNIERTAEYRATGEKTIEWTGVPGYLDSQYFTNIWQPLPKHAWEDLSPEELLKADVSNKIPLSYGPYVIQDWDPGVQISLTPNENYFRKDQNLPKIDDLTFRFIPKHDLALSQLLSGDCDLITHDAASIVDTPALSDAEEKGLVTSHFEPGTVFEHIDFGINPVEEYVTERPDWFDDPRVRQAFVMCTDRQRILDEVLFGKSALINAYVPDNHPLFPEDAVIWPYDVESANTLLDQTGYVDFDEDGLRNDPRLGGEFIVELLTAVGNDTGQKIAELFSENLADCGVAVTVKTIESDSFFSDGPDGPLFGRRFDLAEFPWLISIEPNCALYLSTRTPGPENRWNRNYNNETGFINESFDRACIAAIKSLPGTEKFSENHQEALRVWTDQVPIIPLFLRMKVAATLPEVQGFTLDSTQVSELWNLAELDINEAKD